MPKINLTQSERAVLSYSLASLNDEPHLYKAMFQASPVMWNLIAWMVYGIIDQRNLDVLNRNDKTVKLTIPEIFICYIALDGHYLNLNNDHARESVRSIILKLSDHVNFY